MPPLIDLIKNCAQKRPQWAKYLSEQTFDFCKNANNCETKNDSENSSNLPVWIGLNNKQNHVVGRNLGQNVWCTCKNFQNCIIGLKDMSQNSTFFIK